jgi:hypothetical protein
MISGVWWLINNEAVLAVRNALLIAIDHIEGNCAEFQCTCLKRETPCSQIYRDALHELDSGLHDNEGLIPRDFRPKVTDFIP